jgi:hypothetical protein
MDITEAATVLRAAGDVPCGIDPEIGPGVYAMVMLRGILQIRECRRFVHFIPSCE